MAPTTTMSLARLAVTILFRRWRATTRSMPAMATTPFWAEKATIPSRAGTGTISSGVTPMPTRSCSTLQQRKALTRSLTSTRKTATSLRLAPPELAAAGLNEFSGAALDESSDFNIVANDDGDVEIQHSGGTITLNGVAFTDELTFAALEEAGALEIGGLVQGTEQSEELTGTDDDDLVDALGGDDTITPLGGRGASLMLPKPTGQLTMKKLCFQPRQASEPIIKKVDLFLEAGQTCGIIGPSGSGKSTLCRLIVGAWQPSRWSGAAGRRGRGKLGSR